MPQLLGLGLLIALLAMPLLRAVFERFGVNAFSAITRLAFWLAAILVVWIAAANVQTWRADIGFAALTWQILLLATVAAVILIAMLGAHQYLQKKFGGMSAAKQLHALQKLFALPFGQRLFLVVTAGVVEEVLYRGYAIGIGQHLLGSVWWAGVASITVFTVIHIRWGVDHLLAVFVAALVLTLLFVFTQNLWACIIAHTIVDIFGFVVVPAIIARRRPAAVPGAS